MIRASFIKEFRNTVMGTFARLSRAKENGAPDAACCTECLGFGTTLITKGVGEGRRQAYTVVCDHCNGCGLRAIPMKELTA